MSRNIVVYSDGTGQDGGVRPDQRLSNVYKMFRATRIGPDSRIDPADQIAFYDPGLGTDADAHGVGRLWQTVGKFLASVAGRGIAYNIVDCYEFILNHWRPGDRIFLVGFSRGAYTVRSVAQVLALCGVPLHEADDPETPLRRFSRSTRAVADRAVRRVYEHGAGHPRGDFEAEREELARRFRREHGSDDDGGPNAHPHFVGVFDTVAALGAKGVKRWVVAAGLVAAAAILTVLVSWLVHLVLGPATWLTFAVLAAVLGGSMAWWLRRGSSRWIDDFPNPGDPRRSHRIAWRAANYDRGLSGHVGFARQASAIDEDRDDFPRVSWGRKDVVRTRVGDEPEPLVQIWFAGNHSDVGGSYPETESRLSDVALAWMVEEATSIPGPLFVDAERLRLFPDALGQQHSERESVRDRRLWWVPSWAPAWLREGWTPGARRPSGHPVHPSVRQRFAAPTVVTAAGEGPYRPAVLADDPRFARWYGNAGSPAPVAAPPPVLARLEATRPDASTLSVAADSPEDIASLLEGLGATHASVVLPPTVEEGGDDGYHDDLALRWLDRAASRRGLRTVSVRYTAADDGAEARSARLVLAPTGAVADLVAELGFGSHAPLAMPAAAAAPTA